MPYTSLLQGTAAVRAGLLCGGGAGVSKLRKPAVCLSSTFSPTGIRRLLGRAGVGFMLWSPACQQQRVSLAASPDRLGAPGRQSLQQEVAGRAAARLCSDRQQGCSAADHNATRADAFTLSSLLAFSFTLWRLPKPCAGSCDTGTERNEETALTAGDHTAESTFVGELAASAATGAQTGIEVRGRRRVG
jgi:hypothetical protein